MQLTIDVDCGKYGMRKLYYNPDNCLPLMDQLTTKWEDYWKILSSAYEKMLIERGSSEWGKLNWLYEKEWQIHLYDDFSVDEPMPVGRIIFSLYFVIDGNFNVPNWDVFIDDLQLTHSQPVF